MEDIGQLEQYNTSLYVNKPSSVPWKVINQISTKQAYKNIFDFCYPATQALVKKFRKDIPVCARDDICSIKQNI